MSLVSFCGPMTAGVMLPDETWDGPFCMMASSSYVQLLKVVVSLVGCSGEEFQGILRSLDFRMQKRNVKRPAAAPQAAAAPENLPAEAMPAGETPAEVADIVPDVASESPPDGAVAEEQGATADQPVPVEATSGESLPPAADASVDMVEIEVWWPKDTGPFRRRPEKKAEARPARHKEGRRDRGKEAAEAGTGRTGGNQKVGSGPRREERRKPERAPDPNSPFAVLGSLKDKLTAKSN